MLKISINYLPGGTVTMPICPQYHSNFNTYGDYQPPFGEGREEDIPNQNIIVYPQSDQRQFTTEPGGYPDLGGQYHLDGPGGYAGGGGQYPPDQKGILEVEGRLSLEDNTRRDLEVMAIEKNIIIKKN
jgi:hypothetical protein